MSMVPIGMLLNLLFLVVWRNSPSWFGSVLRGNSLLVGVSVLSIVLWAIFAGLAAALVESASEQLDPMFIAILTTLASIALGFSAVKTGPPAPSGKNSVSKTVLMSRGAAAGMAIGASVWIASMGLPSFPGLSRFSQQYSSQPWYLWLSQGPAVPIGATGPMMPRITLQSQSTRFSAFSCSP